MSDVREVMQIETGNFDFASSPQSWGLGGFTFVWEVMQMGAEVKEFLLETFDSFFQEQFVKESLKQYQLKLIVYNPEQERIERWIN